MRLLGAGRDAHTAEICCNSSVANCISATILQVGITTLHHTHSRKTCSPAYNHVIAPAAYPALAAYRQGMLRAAPLSTYSAGLTCPHPLNMQAQMFITHT